MKTNISGHPSYATKQINGHAANSSGNKPEHRIRMLICACPTREAIAAIRFNDDIESIYLPSDDPNEIREEIERMNPKYIFCGADFFLNFYPEHSPGFAGSAPAKQNGRHIQKQGSTPTLTKREVELLEMLTRGFTNEQIANGLQLSARTVKRILSILFERLGVANRTELTGRAAELHLVPEED